MGQIKVFLDSDVVISALLSQKGASFEILKNSQFKKIITEAIKVEVGEVAKRLNIFLSPKDVFQGIEVISLQLDRARLVETFLPYVLDEEDSHVVAGAQKAKVNFLLTHNVKHYHKEKIKDDFKIVTMKPGYFLQYVRSL